MKHKIVRILGVLVTLATLMSLFVSATPVSADIHEWSKVTIPSTTGYVTSDNAKTTINRVGLLVYNSDNSAIYASATITKTDAPAYAGPAIFKSTDSGRTWKLLKIPTLTAAWVGPGPAGGNPIQIFDIVAPGVDEVYFTDGKFIYTSKDGGTTWTTLTDLYQYATDNLWTLTPVGYIVSIDATTSSIGKYVFAGTAVFGGGVAVNGAYVCKESEYGVPWDDLGVMTQRAAPFPGPACNVWDIKVDPTDFAVKQGVFAVVETPVPITIVTAKYQGNQWNQASLCRDAEIKQENTSNITNPYHAEIWLPSDFNSSLTGGKFQAWIAIATSGPWQGDVYYWMGGNTATIDLNVNGVSSSTEVSDISGRGGVADARLIVGGFYNAPAPGNNKSNVWYSADHFTFTKSSKGPTGLGGWSPWGYEATVLALADYQTSGKALVGTARGDCGVSYTADFGKTFNTISLMNYELEVIEDIGGDLFMTTYDGDITMLHSVWRLNADGWERVMSQSMYAITGCYDVDATASGDAIFVAEMYAAASAQIWRSLDNGQVWTKQWSNITLSGGTGIDAWAVVNKDTLLVSDTSIVDSVFVTTTNGILWFKYECKVGYVTDFAFSGSTWLAAGVSAFPGNITVAKSTDSGVTWSTLKVPGSSTTTATLTATANWAYVEAANDFATSGNVFVTGEDNNGVFRYPNTAANAWLRVDGDAYDILGDVDSGVGLVAGPGGPGSTAEGLGMIYATDEDGSPDGVKRIRGVATEAENLAAPSSVTFYGLWLTASGTDNVLWTIGDPSSGNDALYTYTDTLNKAGSGVSLVSSTYYGTAIYGFDPGFPTGIFVAVVKWNAMTNAEDYAVYISDDVDDDGLYDLYEADLAGLYSWDDATQVTLTPLAPNTTYYVSVWAVTESASGDGALCSSFLFDKKPMSFTTAPAVPNWTPNLSPMSGAQNVQVGPTPFDWDDVTGATGYEFQIAEGNGIPSGTATVSLTVSSHSISNLKNSTFYTWRVRAMNGTVAGEWITSVFTTVAAVEPPVTIAPAPPAPTINLPQPTVIVNPAPITITIPPGTTLPAPTLVLPEAETPVYIWIIVAVGALLTVAVIVLIIRTRRVV